MARAEAVAKSKDAFVESEKRKSPAALDPPGGPVERLDLAETDSPPLPNKYHVVVTNDAGLYGRWQTLVNYYWYRKVKAADPNGPMGGYTRLLHCSQPDDVMHLVPTIVVEHLPIGIDRGYGPMHRPWAFTQWLARVHIPEDYILMSEPDHVFVSQPPLIATPEAPAAFPFWYVDCKDAKTKPHCMKPAINPRGIKPEAVPPIGNSPTMIHKKMFAEMLPRWDRTVRTIHADLEADAALGWAQEMFGFSLSLANSPGGPPNVQLYQPFMVQPPFDHSLLLDTCKLVVNPTGCGKPDAERTVTVGVIHYTYGQDFDERGQHTYGRVGPWHWDKRDFGAHYPPLPIKRPPVGTPNVTLELVQRVEEAGYSKEYWPMWEVMMQKDWQHI